MISWTSEVMLAIGRLEAAGYEAWLVGGSLRDALMGRQSKDCDLASNATPEEVGRVFADFRVIETGIKHGTVTVLVEDIPIEITTYRTEGTYTDGRRPDAVRFVGDIREDLSRRDFTMNAMACHPERGLLDPFGGAADIHAGLIRCVGSPEKRFSEDGLRILRALRFASVLGFAVQEDTRAAIFSGSEMLRKVSAERLAAEIDKLICGIAAAEVLLSYVEVLGVVIPELLQMKDVPQNNPHHIYNVLEHTAAALGHTPPQPQLRWSVLLHDIGKPFCRSTDAAGIDHFCGHNQKGEEMAREILQRLRFDKATVSRVSHLVGVHDLLIEPEPRRVRRALSRLTPEIFFPLLQIKRADTLAQAPACRARLAQIRLLETMARDALNEAAVFDRTDLAVDGNDLIDHGLQGKEIGRQLQILLDAVLDGRVQNERQNLLSYLEEEYNIASGNAEKKQENSE